MRVRVVGAGFAGLAAATLLARAGHRVRVLERFPVPQSVAGAGILIQPTGIAALRALGVDSVPRAVLERGARIDNLLGVTPRGRPVVDLVYSRWRSGAAGLGLHRGVLFDALWRAACDAGVHVQLGTDVTSLAHHPADHVGHGDAAGARARAGAGDDDGDGDDDDELVVVANGAASSLRAALPASLRVRERLYPWGAMWCMLDDDSYGNTLWQVYDGAHRMLGVMPTGRAPDRDTHLVSVFWSVHAERVDAFRARGLDAWKHDVLAMMPRAARLLEQVHSLDQLQFVRYRDVIMPRAFHAKLGERTHVVVIGDAAHATSPQLGQGTNLALIDAVTLAHCIAQHSRRSGSADVDVAAALDAYTRMRRRHVHYIGQASRLLTPFFQSDARVAPFLRDLFLAPFARAPLAGALQMQTLVGVRTSWLGLSRQLTPERIEALAPRARSDT